MAKTPPSATRALDDTYKTLHSLDFRKLWEGFQGESFVCQAMITSRKREFVLEPKVAISLCQSVCVKRFFPTCGDVHEVVLIA